MAAANDGTLRPSPPAPAASARRCSSASPRARCSRPSRWRGADGERSPRGRVVVACHPFPAHVCARRLAAGGPPPSSTRCLPISPSPPQHLQRRVAQPQAFAVDGGHERVAQPRAQAVQQEHLLVLAQRLDGRRQEQTDQEAAREGGAGGGQGGAGPPQPRTGPQVQGGPPCRQGRRSCRPHTGEPAARAPAPRFPPATH
jgi:hypothetical protein